MEKTSHSEFEALFQEMTRVAWDTRGMVEFPLERNRNTSHTCPVFELSRRYIDQPAPFTTLLTDNEIHSNFEDNIAKIQGKSAPSQIHPQTLIAVMLGEDLLHGYSVEGGYGVVSTVNTDGLIDTHETMHTNPSFNFVVKSSPLIDEEVWDKMLLEIVNPTNRILSHLKRVCDPQANDAISEVIIHWIVGTRSWYTCVVPTLLGTVCEDPYYIIRTPNNEDPKPPPQLHSWYTRLETYEYNCADNDNSGIISFVHLMHLETILSQAIVGMIAMSDIGVTHNDLHMSNLMCEYANHPDSFKIRVPIASEHNSGECDCVELALPSHRGARIRIIDFGLAEIRTHCGDTGRDFAWGGGMMRYLGMNSGTGLRGDLRTLALDMYKTTPKLLKHLLKTPESPYPSTEGSRAWNFIREVLLLCFRQESSTRSLHTLFQNTRELKILANKLGVSIRSYNKNLYSLSGKYHLLREIVLCDGQKMVPITRGHILEILKKYYPS